MGTASVVESSGRGEARCSMIERVEIELEWHQLWMLHRTQEVAAARLTAHIVLDAHLIRCKWSVVGGWWSVVSGQWSVVGGQWSVVSGQCSVVGDQRLVVSGHMSYVWSLPMRSSTRTCTSTPAMTSAGLLRWT